ncbi:hypothetical protein [Pseudophaeobacter sp.]|uniref:hypothetical protein n=1 Tax=Pseudophaeobacter sp. TaxID=1971739 RepID=UPI003298624D
MFEHFVEGVHWLSFVLQLFVQNQLLTLHLLDALLVGGNQGWAIRVYYAIQKAFDLLIQFVALRADQALVSLHLSRTLPPSVFEHL